MQGPGSRGPQVWPELSLDYSPPAWGWKVISEHPAPLALTQWIQDVAFWRRQALVGQEHTGKGKGSWLLLGLLRRPTRAGGENVDKGCDAAAADEGQEHVIVEGPAHLIIKEIRPPVQNLDFAGGVERKHRSGLQMAVDTWRNRSYPSP